ncbi:hypothetical protein C8241_05245 [Paracidovorax avenae]|nr:hypothetical protein C8241_05245 [Paracidovorax avenae]
MPHAGRLFRRFQGAGSTAAAACATGRNQENVACVLAGLPFPDLFRPGRWRTWGPDGKPIAITRTSPRDGGEPVKGPLADVLMKKP